MIGGILLLAIVIFGISIMFGKGKVENFYKFLVWLIVAPFLLAIGYNHLVWFWLNLPLWIQILSVLLIPFFVSAILKLMFPKAKWLNNLQAAVFQALIYIVTFPIRFLWRAGQFLFERERRTQRLNPYHPVVGTRPPLQNERRQTNQRGNFFD